MPALASHHAPYDFLHEYDVASILAYQFTMLTCYIALYSCRPTPPVRTKRTQSNTPTSSPRSGTLERKTTGGRGPQRRAPPPPVSRRAAPNPPPPSPIQPKDDDESLTAL